VRSLWLALAPTLTLLAPGAEIAADDPLEFPVDGWYSWQVPAVDNAPNWCCLHWSAGRSTAIACDLEGNHFNFADDSSQAGTYGEVQVYALIRDGKAVRVRALSPACPVESREPIRHIGRVEPAVSLAWLKPQVHAKVHKEDSNALAAIAVHRGREALAFLTDLALHEKDAELREEAVFWLGQVRITESRATIVDLMFGDKNPDLRAHAAFSLAQSSAPDRTELLIRLGREDRDADVRGQAWLWLAQTGAPESEAAIFAALRQDPSAGAREEAVFALSELPDERAVRSLVKIVHDAGWDRVIREQALFWLVQSDSDEAYEAIDTLLSKRE
jgi:HEAT repeats